MNATERNWIWIGTAVLGLCALPIATAALANAVADAFWGIKEPMFETAGGLLLGLIAAPILALAMGLCRYCGGVPKFIVASVLAFDVAAMPLGWLLVNMG